MSNESGKGIQCANCMVKIYSNHRHDYKRCKCGDCFVDGGYSYLRYGYKNKAEVRIVDREESYEDAPNN